MSDQKWVDDLLETVVRTYYELVATLNDGLWQNMAEEDKAKLCDLLIEWRQRMNEIVGLIEEEIYFLDKLALVLREGNISTDLTK